MKARPRPYQQERESNARTDQRFHCSSACRMMSLFFTADKRLRWMVVSSGKAMCAASPAK
jgi:hypothetical protein